MASGGGFLFAVLLCFSCWFVNNADAVLNDGLYVSNGTDILFIANPDSSSSSPKSIYKQAGTIVGLAYEKSSGDLFWSTVDVMTRGIYRAVTDSSGNIHNVSKIVDQDVLEVNGLTFDWVSKHLYWTDSRKRTVEVSDVTGNKRRILLMTGLACPRGIYADPKSGYLFWTDQGHKRIERSRLDGSDRKVIVDRKGKVGLPNQIIVYDGKVYWADSETKTLESSNIHGHESTWTSSNKLTADDNQHVFGLAVDDQRNFYVTSWNPGRLIRTTSTSGASSSFVAGTLGEEKIFSAIYVKQSNQPGSTSDSPCRTKGCESLCFRISENEARCACPSYGAKTLDPDKKKCRDPPSIVLFAVASSGFVCFRDPEVQGSDGLETYVVGRSLRPVAVAYDSLKQVVYWSDVHERTIHSAKIDGSEHKILLGSQNGIGLVEGMVVDVGRRQLFYTNIGSVLIEETPYSWHRVETIRLDTDQVKVKTLVTTADKPRGLALDSANGHIYYTDWGSRASIVRASLDGSDVTLIRTGLDNPNGIAIANGKLYFVDSHFKTRQKDNRYPSDKPKNGSLYSMNLDGSGLMDVLRSSGTKFQTPFGLAAGQNGDLYVSDWDTKSLSVLENSQGPAKDFLAGIDEIMAVYFSPFNKTGSASNECSGKSCVDFCVALNASSAQCTCSSYGGKSATGSSCEVPKKFLLVADMNSIKIVSLDERESTPTIAFQGNPYLANYAALTYNPTTGTVYYSDVNRRAIRALHLKNSTTEIIYRVNDVIDGLVFHDNALYWTDYVNGKISKLTVGSQTATHVVEIKGLSRPRGIRIHKEHIYWTEWGQNPRVARRMLGANEGVQPEVIYDNKQQPNIVWPNGLFIDESKDRLYFVDGNMKFIFNCSLTGGCQSIPGTEHVLKHAYDVWFVDGAFYYSDWKSGAVNAFRPDNPKAPWQVAGGLMRPTQMYIGLSSTSSSSSPVTSQGCGTCSGGECVPLIVNPTCNCKDKVPSKDKKSCAASSGTCSTNSKHYKYGEEFAPNACISCQCSVGTAKNYTLDPVYSDSLCRRVECPPLDCPKEEIQAPDSTECCPSCTKCGIRITNCPKGGDVSLTLPPDLGFVVHDYLASVRDCRGLSREIGFERNPAGTVYEKGSRRVSVTARTKNPEDSNTCSYTVTVSDKTPPRITCPGDVLSYSTDDSAVSVKWESPVAFDNVGLSGSPVPSAAWGSSFSPGSYQVTYRATDTSGLSSSCAFNINVTKLSTTQGTCKVPAVANGRLDCSDSTNELTCTVTSCNSGYTMKNSQATSYKCRNGNWTPIVEDHMLRGICFKEKPQSVVGSLDITGSGVGDCSDIDLRYVEKFLQFSVKKDFVRTTDLQDTVTASCGASNNNLIVKVKLTGDAGSEQEINEKLKEIKAELESGFLKVNYRNGRGVHSVQTPTSVRNDASRTCLAGEVLADGICEVCPAGKYKVGGMQDGRCEKCEENHYNDIEGQTQCKPCPDGQKSDPGAYIVDQCITPTVPFPVAIVAAVVGILLLVVVIIIVVVACRRRSRYNPKRHSTVHGNSAYGCYLDDETYDKIDEPKMDFTPTGAGANTLSNQNHYEGLQQGNGQGPDNYDIIGGGEEEGACGEGGGGGSIDGSSSTNSTPSYLAPKATPPYLTPVI